MASFFQHVLLTPAHKQTLIYPASVSSESESFQNYNCPSIRLPQQPARMALLWMEPCWMLYCQWLYTWRRGVSHYSQSLIRLMHCLTNQRVHTTPAHLHLFTHYCMKLQRLFLLYKNNIFDDFFTLNVLIISFSSTLTQELYSNYLWGSQREKAFYACLKKKFYTFNSYYTRNWFKNIMKLFLFLISMHLKVQDDQWFHDILH